MQLSDAGQMIEPWWKELARKYKGLELDIAVVMPNHFHGILFLVNAGVCVGPAARGEDTGTSLPSIVQWFKTMTTNAYIRGVKERGWPLFAGQLWQRTYYDRILRDEADLNQKRDYILTNPARWLDDENYLP
jgi:putative transposase